VPRDVITAKCAPYLRRGKPEARTALQNLDDYDIVAAYGPSTGDRPVLPARHPSLMSLTGSASGRLGAW